VVIDEFRQPDPISNLAVRPFPTVTINSGPRDRKTAGSFETWTCLGCGYTEFCANEPDTIEALAEQYPDQVRILDPKIEVDVDAGPSTRGPYR
jgi:hypothetical protein